MPTPTALDIIAAGIQDIATALTNPVPNSPLNPLTSQQTEALHDLVTIFNGSLPDDDNEKTPLPLSVEPKKARTEPHAPPTPPEQPITTTYAEMTCQKPRRKQTPMLEPAMTAPKLDVLRFYFK
jgi:hypothetical protein